MVQQPLPDFTQVGPHFAQASNELQQQLQRMNNVPPVALAQITNQLMQITNQIMQAVTRLEQAIARLDTKLDTTNNNNMARIQNTYAMSPADPLAALVNTTTGAFIPNFPPYSTSITRLNATQLRAILQELGQEIPAHQAGGIAFLRRQLRVQLGLRGEQVQGA